MPDIELLRRDIDNITRDHGAGCLSLLIGILEESMIRTAIAGCKTYNAAAKLLGISKSTMYRKMREHGIPKKRQNHLARGGERDAPGDPL